MPVGSAAALYGKTPLGRICNPAAELWPILSNAMTVKERVQWKCAIFRGNLKLSVPQDCKSCGAGGAELERNSKTKDWCKKHLLNLQVLVIASF